jgi:hypothetical protein
MTADSKSDQEAVGCGFYTLMVVVSMIGLAAAGYMRLYELFLEYVVVMLFIYVSLHDPLNAGSRWPNLLRKMTPSWISSIVWGKADYLRAAMSSSSFAERWKPIRTILFKAAILGCVLTFVVGLVRAKPWGQVVWRELLEIVLDIGVFLPLSFVLVAAFHGFIRLASVDPATLAKIKERMKSLQKQMDASGARRMEHGLSDDEFQVLHYAIILPQRLKFFCWLGPIIFALSFVSGLQNVETGEQALTLSILNAIKNGPTWARAIQ